MKNDLFDETSVLINCVLRDKIFTITMIDIDVIEYAFIDESFAQSLCEILKIESVQLIKKRLIRVYDERKDQVITHVIYSKMIIQEHTKSLISMLIIRFEQQTLILEKSWMRKHEVSYHEKTNIIKFFSEFCTHSKKIETKTTSSSNKEKNISFEKKFFLNQSDHSKFDDSIKNSKKSLTMSSKFFFEKNLILINQRLVFFEKNLILINQRLVFFEKNLILINQRLVFFEKTKNHRNRSIELKIRKRLKISDSILMNSKSLIRKRRNHCSWWTSRW
jgi:hypothetical protein